MSNEETFGQRLKVLREKTGLSQAKLSEQVNVSLKTVQRWEKDERQPRIEEVLKLAEVLGISEGELLNGSPEQPGQWVLQIRIAHEFREEVIDMRRGIPRKASITTTPDGGYLCLGGDYSLWTDDNNFKKFLADIKKFREAVIQNGIALGGVQA